MVVRTDRLGRDAAEQLALLKRFRSGAVGLVALGQQLDLANPHGREEPEITSEFIGFNGVAACGHARNPDVRLPWPADDAAGAGSNSGMGSVLPYRTCNGDCSYESVWFERSERTRAVDSRVDSFCKTAFRPYDLAVMAFLVIAKHHLGSELRVETDSRPSHWAEAFALCQGKLGYGARYSFRGRHLGCTEEALCG